MAEMTVQRIAEIRDLNNFEERKVLFSVIDDLCDAWEQQRAEIERLTIREHRLTEYMRDVKNYALTLREVSQNAIDEGDAQ